MTKTHLELHFAKRKGPNQFRLCRGRFWSLFVRLGNREMCLLAAPTLNRS